MIESHHGGSKMSSSKSVSSSLMCPSVEVAAWHLDDMGVILAKQKKSYVSVIATALLSSL